MDYLDIRELYHFGILGQKWGIRRYQNPDGSLTPEGKARYAKYITSAGKANEVFNKELPNINDQVKESIYYRNKLYKAYDKVYENYEKPLQDASYNNDFNALEGKGINLDWTNNREQWDFYERKWEDEIYKAYEKIDKESCQKLIDECRQTESDYFKSMEKTIGSLIGERKSILGTTAGQNLFNTIDDYIDKFNNSNTNGTKYKNFIKFTPSLVSEGLVPETVFEAAADFNVSPGRVVADQYFFQFVD